MYFVNLFLPHRYVICVELFEHDVKARFFFIILFHLLQVLFPASQFFLVGFKNVFNSVSFLQKTFLPSTHKGITELSCFVVLFFL